jgi:hypothetical protein
MTTRYKSFIVSLEHDIRDDDADAIITALKMVKGVLRVEPQEATVNDLTIQYREKSELRKKLFDFLMKLDK